MKSARGQSHAISGVFTFTLLCIFAVFSTALVLLGVQAYRNSSQHSKMHNDQRILTAYLRSALRSMDEEDSCYAQTIDGIDTLNVAAVYDGERYVTRYYCYEGKLREWFSSEAYDFFPEDGEEICDAADFKVTMENGLVNARICSVDGEWHPVMIAMRCGSGDTKEVA